MTALPTARDAMFSAIELWQSGDRDAARFWLDVAREIREDGQQCVLTGRAGERAVDETQTIRAQQEATEVIRMATRVGDCPACGKELFIGKGGARIHRSSYKTECDSVLSPVAV